MNKLKPINFLMIASLQSILLGSFIVEGIHGIGVALVILGGIILIAGGVYNLVNYFEWKK